MQVLAAGGPETQERVVIAGRNFVRVIPTADIAETNAIQGISNRRKVLRSKLDKNIAQPIKKQTETEQAFIDFNKNLMLNDF